MTALQLDIFSPRWSSEVLDLPPANDEGRGEYRDPFLAFHEARLTAAGEGRLTFDEASWDHAARGAVGVDVECFENFFLICFKRFIDGRRLAFERSNRAELPVAEIEAILRGNTTISFNGLSYDLPMIALALSGAPLHTLKTATNAIISGSWKPWQVERELGIRLPRYDHIDLMEPNPSVRQGLKVLHGRLHGRFLVDLPFDSDAWLSPREMNVVTLYCHNDIDATEALYRALREPLELRVALGRRYGLDLRSRSDAQVGEAIVKRRIELLSGRRLGRPDQPIGNDTFRYVPPPFLHFTSPHLRDLLDELRAATFHVNGFGKIATPPVLEEREVRIGDGTYAMGIGGLHSTEAHRTLSSDKQNVLIDVDVASQYPNIIRTLGLHPRALGPTFTKVYGELIDERMTAKEAGRQGDTAAKVMAEGLKLGVNGVFGKLGSAHSILYAPHLLVATTLTGQLVVLMLIERGEAAGIPVVSANTDGIIFNCPRRRADDLDRLLADWEADTGFVTERTRYASLHSSSVNTYLAVKEGGGVKRKGWLADPWSEGDRRGQLQKNPQMTVCSEAAMRYLTEGVSIQSTVFGCTDPRAFVTVIRASAGATWRGHPLGKVVRYYWAYDGAPILSGGKNRVSKTEGARPLAELPDEVPADADRLRYCEETVRLLADLGVRL